MTAANIKNLNQNHSCWIPEQMLFIPTLRPSCLSIHVAKGLEKLTYALLFIKCKDKLLLFMMTKEESVDTLKPWCSTAVVIIKTD